jgi:hypothetical protein
VADWPAVAALVGLLASVTYGVQDFIGGVVSRRNHVFTVVLTVLKELIGRAQLAGLLPAAAGVVLITLG